MSNNSAESNPFGNEDEEDIEENQAKQNLSDNEIEKPVYLNVRVRALYDYSTNEEDELSFKAGKKTLNKEKNLNCNSFLR